MSGRLLEDNEIQARFRELRLRMGWSQARAAEEFGVAQPTISEWETSGPIPKGRLAQMADFASVPVAYLFVEHEEETEAERERRDRLVAAEWMERVAELLRAGPIPTLQDRALGAADVGAASLPGDTSGDVTTAEGTS